MSYNIFTPFLQLREFDDSGKLLANGWMYFYQAGTSTLGDVYADSIGTAAPNPVQLNGAGTARIFGPPVAFKVVIEDANHVELFEIDNVFPFGVGSGSTGLGTVAVVANYAGLRSLTQDYNAVIVCGYAVAGDGGGGMFFKSSTLAADNNGTILQRAGSTRYARNYSGLIDPRWFGVQYGTAIDQTAAMDAAALVGHVQIDGLFYQTSDHHYKGAYTFLPGGGIYSSGGANPTAYFDDGAKIYSGAAGMFASTINVNLGKSVCDQIHLSWFADPAKSNCSIYNYKFLIDKDWPSSVGVTIPANFETDFAGGAKIAFSALANLSIANLAYRGVGQIVSYDTLAHVGTIDLGGVPAYMEWFGGVSGASFGVDNQIPAKAWFLSGSAKMLASYYRVTNSGTAWTTNKSFALDGTGTLDCDNAVHFTALDVGAVTWTGKGAITVDGVANLDKTKILSTISTTSGATELDASIYTPKAYIAMGAGLAEQSSDLTAWAAISGLSGTIKGIWLAGQWLAAGTAAIWRSVDGTTWTSTALGSQQFNKVKKLNGVWVAVGNAGTIYTSADGISWTVRTSGTTASLNDVAWTSIAGYIVVGASGFVATSSDLITWTPRTLPGTGIGALNAVATSGTTIIASGATGGSYYRSTDGATWTQSILVTTETIYSAFGTADTIILTGGAGNIHKSSTSGITFQKVNVAGSALLSCFSVAGDWIIGSTAGIVYHSSDLATFTSSDTGVSVDVLAVATLPSIWALVGKSNTVKVSTNGIDWTTPTVDGSTADWLNIRSFFGITYLVGKTGRLFYTIDFQTFTQVASGTTEDIYDIGYIAGQYLIVGSNGMMRSAPNVAIPSPTWTAQTSGTTDALIRCASSGSLLVVASASKIWQGTTVSGLTQNNYGFNGICRAVGGWVLYGNGGSIYTSNDLTTWTKRSSGTTSDLVDAAVNGSLVVIVGKAGAITRSTDGVTWTAATSGADNINAVAYNAGRNEMGFCTEGGKSYRSADSGATWILMDSVGGAVFKGIWARGSEWNVCGLANQWRYSSDATTWTQRVGTVGLAPTPVSPYRPAFGAAVVDLWSGEGDIAVGQQLAAFGFPLKSAIYSVNDMRESPLIVSTTTAFKKIRNGTILDDAGNSYRIDPASGIYCVPSNLVASGSRNLWHDTTSNSMIAVGDNVWQSLDSTGAYRWSKLIVAPAGILDLRYESGFFYACGSNGFNARSSGVPVWSWAGIDGDTSTHYDVYLTGIQTLYGNPYPNGRTAVIGGGRILIGGVGGVINFGSSASDPVLSCGTLNASGVTSDVSMFSTNPAQISASTLHSVSHLGAVSDSTVTNQNGSLAGNIVRSQISAVTTLPVVASIVIADGSKIEKTDAADSTKAPLFSISGNTLQIDNSTVEPNGGLIVSADPSVSIRLNGCQNSQNFAFPLTNGIAKVYLNQCGVGVKNASAYSIDGVTLEDSETIPLYGAYTATNAVIDWKGLPGGSTSDGTTITLGAAMPLAASVDSTETLRYINPSTPPNGTPVITYDAVVPNAINLLLEFGGKIQLTVEYPIGYIPSSKSKPVAALVKPRFDAYRVAGGPRNDFRTSCGDKIVSASRNAFGVGTQIKTVCTSYVWGGSALANIFPDSTGTSQFTVDQWQDRKATSNGVDQSDNYPISGHVLARTPRIVVFNDGAGELPSGTKITVVVTPFAPKTPKQYSAFFPAVDTSTDATTKIEKQSFTFFDGTGGVLACNRPVDASSEIQTGTQYDADFTTSTGFIIPGDPRKSYPAATSSLSRVEIKLDQLKSPYLGLTLTTSTLSTVTIPGILDRQIVDHGAWSMVSHIPFLSWGP